MTTTQRWRHRYIRPSARLAAAAGLVAVGVSLTGPASSSTRPTSGPIALSAAVTSAPNTISQLPAAPSSTAVPGDGRLRGNGFAATVLGVAAGPRTATERAGPGQQLWQFGLTATTSPPANGGSPVDLTAALVVGSVTVPVPLPAPPADGGTIGPLWFEASLPATTGPGGDVVLSLTAAGDTQTFSLAHMTRTGTAPAASYRDPTNPTVTTTPAAAVNIPESFADGFANHASTYPIHVALKTVTLGYFAPDTPNHPAANPAGAWLWVTLSSDGTHSPDQDPYSDPYLIIKQAVAASAVTLTIPGQPAEASTIVPGRGGDTGTNNTNGNPTDMFPDTYLFAVPANLTTATLTVTPGPISASLSSTATGLAGTATPTPAGANAALAVTLPAATTPAPPPPGASSTPSALSGASTLRGTARPASALRPPGVPTTTSSYLLVWFLVAAGIAATIVTVVLVAARQRRRPTLTTAPPSGPAPAWPTPGPYAPPPTWAPPVTGTPPPPEPATTHDPPATSPVEQAPAVPDPRRSSNGPPPAQPAATASPSERAEPDLPSSYPPPPLPAPAIRVLGVVVLEGWANPPAATNLIELATYLAVRNTAVSADTLRNRLSPHADTDLGKQTIRVYCSRLRGHLDPGVELVSTRAGYHLTGITTDLATFSDLATRDPGGDPDAAIERLGHALALITGPPLARADYRWAAADNLAATITTQTRTAALRLVELSLHTNPALARWACHQALLANPADQTLAAAALDAAAAIRAPGTLADEWADTTRRLQMAGTEIDSGLEAHYRRLRAPAP